MKAYFLVRIGILVYNDLFYYPFENYLLQRVMGTVYQLLSLSMQVHYANIADISHFYAVWRPA